MFRKHTNRLVLSSVLACVALFTVVDTADAQSRRVRWDPDYGAPFANLGWRGEAIVNYGTCSGPGTVDNSPGSCNGALSFASASVEFYNTSAPATTLQKINFGSGAVAALTFDGSNELTDVYSTPFAAKQGSIVETDFNESQAWFSLYFVGKYAQLYWYRDDPSGNTSSAYLGGCYKPGLNSFAGNKCGISSNLDGQGAVLKITPVPEPETYALMLFGMATLAFVAQRRRRR